MTDAGPSSPDNPSSPQVQQNELPAGPPPVGDMAESSGLMSADPNPIPETAPSDTPVIKSDEIPEVREVLLSEIGVSTLLNRLKQSITSAKEFAVFLKKRSSLEDDHAKGLKKLCRNSQDTVRHQDHRQGTFVRSYEEMLTIHDRMAENGIQFALSLHQMHEDLLEVANVSEKHRKGWKQNGLEPEQRLAALETAARKAKTKYDSLAEEYDRVRTGEVRQGAKAFGFKGPKSAAQQEEDLLRKTQAADTDYSNKIQTYLSEKASIESNTRPEAVQALQDLVRECDAATTLQMQKFASFNEKLLLSNGLVISPLKGATIPSQQTRSMKEAIQAVNNKDDFESYIKSFSGKVAPKGSEPKYERNPVFGQTGSTPINQAPASRPQTQQQSSPSQPMPPLQTQIPPVSSSGSANPYSTLSPSSHQESPNMGLGAGPQRPPMGGHERSFSHGAMLNSPGTQNQQQQNRNSTQIVPGSQNRFNGGGVGSPQGGPPQLGALPFMSSDQSGGYPPPDPTQPAVRSVSPPSAVPGAMSRSKQVFGVSLGRLYERDANAVPMVVYQCIQAVDLYGLNVEGIYRLSGSSTHVNKLKNLFDTDSESHILDFRNPENFFHDVNSVAGLLKQFLRDLPDPLLTAEHYGSFIESAKSEDETVRRDSLHAIINGLPDPNYATLRALIIHLNRIIENSSVNRMNAQNLAIVFGPTLMGTAPGSNIADAGWQVRVVDTILQNTYQIFDED